ncbi:hypothetical protein OG21DRAFT_1508021 [Imleria badia]|nr:hypothetical protein OG21DRAFT_1508021 [Imleria badia]
MFWAQVGATILSGMVQLGIQAWMFTNIPNMCSPTQKDAFICLNTEVFATVSIVWGVIGLMRMFLSGQIYSR